MCLVLYFLIGSKFCVTLLPDGFYSLKAILASFSFKIWKWDMFLDFPVKCGLAYIKSNKTIFNKNEMEKITSYTKQRQRPSFFWAILLAQVSYFKLQANIPLVQLYGFKKEERCSVKVSVEVVHVQPTAEDIKCHTGETWVYCVWTLAWWQRNQVTNLIQMTRKPKVNSPAHLLWSHSHIHWGCYNHWTDVL